MSDRKDRPRGILTPKDRELLRGEIEYKNRQQYSNRRADIRERIANGLLDFSIIQYLLQDKDRKLIFREPSEQANVEELDLPSHIQSAFFWLYLGLNEQNYNIDRLIEDAVKEAEKEFARKYWGESIDVTVNFSVDVERTYAIEDIIKTIERGGPIKAEYIYNLLQMSQGVQIDTERLDVVRVYFQSSYMEGEKAVLETIFSEYLGVEVEIRDAEERIPPSEVGGEIEDATIESNQPSPKPSEIKNHPERSLEGGTDEGWAEELRRERKWLDKTEGNQEESNGEFVSPLDEVFDTMLEDADEPSPSIYELIEQRSIETDSPAKPTPDTVRNVLEVIREPIVSTTGIALSLDCADEAAKHALGELFEEGIVEKEFVVDKDGERLMLWWLSTNSPFE